MSTWFLSVLYVDNGHALEPEWPLGQMTCPLIMSCPHGYVGEGDVASSRLVWGAESICQAINEKTERNKRKSLHSTVRSC